MPHFLNRLWYLITKSLFIYPAPKFWAHIATSYACVTLLLQKMNASYWQGEIPLTPLTAWTIRGGQ